VKSNRDDQPWRSWLAQHGPALLLLARQHCCTRGDAEDAVQDGFVRFWRSRDRAHDATAYLFACVRSAAMDLSRSARRRGRYESQTQPLGAADDWTNDLERAELRATVATALQTLPAEQREVLVMKIWGELTFAQIATALQIKPDTAASRYRYALEKLELALPKEMAR
jgi:RNA polymerase sigma-70 factor (ECF subfamily)